MEVGKRFSYRPEDLQLFSLLLVLLAVPVCFYRSGDSVLMFIVLVCL